jgi:Ca2+ transporting ATPase
VRVFVKGATEAIVELCSNVIGENGESVELDESTKDAILGDDGVLKKFARKCYRCLATSYKDYDAEEWQAIMEANGDFQDLETVNYDQIESGLTLACIFGLMDPLRPGIKMAVEQCHKSGITVRMCTGDNIDTACAISLSAGIVTEEELAQAKNDDEDNRSYVCMTGVNFYNEVGGLHKTTDKEGKEREMIKNTNKFEKIAKELRVLARSRPEDKYVLVTGLKQLGHVVAVTGDGANDAPALAKSDIGFAMGIAGQEVAKKSADIILMDDDFCGVITAIKYGRNVFDSVRKFLQFQITVNVVAMFIVFSGSVIFSDPPLNSV